MVITANRTCAPFRTCGPYDQKPGGVGQVGIDHVVIVVPVWERYDPGVFMDQMRQMRKQINALAPDVIEGLIATGQNARLLRSLSF